MMDNIQSIKDNLTELYYNNRYLVCTYDCAYQVNDFIQVQVKTICDEPDYLGCNSTWFEAKSQDDSYFVKGSDFENMIYEDTGEDMTALPLDAYLNTLENYLKHKLIIIKPYYTFNERRETFYKNGQALDAFNKNRDLEDNYFCIPLISKEASFESFKAHREFSLPISKTLVGTPRYISYNHHIYSVNVEEKTNYYWQTKDDDQSINEIEIDYDKALNDFAIIEAEDFNFIFVNRETIINAGVKKVEVKKNDDDETVVVNYESSRAGKCMKSFFEYTKSKNLCYSLNDIYNFYTCACSSQLIILAGMSGTGKTRLPLSFAEYFGMSEENEKLLFVPVLPSYTEPSDILGYLNPMTNTYNSSDCKLVEFLKHAQDHEDEMHMVIFDEMNLSQIEFWFAPFISIMEKNLVERKLRLYSEYQECKNSEAYPSSINLGRNLIFVGTINLDETTKNISDRLLDRSFIINLKKESFKNYNIQQSQNINDQKVATVDFINFMPKDFDLSNGYITQYNLRELEFFDTIHEQLNKVDPQKGVSFRAVKNIALYLENKPDELDKKLAFDYAFKQTIMKKINGSVDSIGEFLGYSLDGNDDGILVKIFDSFDDISDFKECRNEINAKLVELNRYGYTR